LFGEEDVETLASLVGGDGQGLGPGCG
jgi:hypothetical protein